MGDVTNPQNSEATAPPPTDSSSVGRPSIDMLKETAELSDITNQEKSSVKIDGDDASSYDKIANSDDNENSKTTKSKQDVSIKTVFENVGMDKIAPSEAPLEPVPDPPQEISSGRMNKIRDQSSNIFPAGIMGCKDELPSPRRFIDAVEASQDSAGHIENTPRKMCNTKVDSVRNPLTGTGVDSTDELKNVPSKKKVDGNPLLGLGYDKRPSSNSSTRIPPGGFSNGLW